MLKKYLITIFIVLLISGCINLNPKKDISRASTLYKGTKGLELSFVKNAPPSRVFEDGSLEVIVKIGNKGVYDIGLNGDGKEGISQRGIFVITPETGYVDLKKIKEEEGIYSSEGVESASFKIMGKSLSNPVGDELFIYSALKARELSSLSSVHSSSIFATICYPYQTKLSTSVCIDPDIYNFKPEEKACESKNLVFSGGQGAPVAITKIEVQMVSEDDEVKPLFLVHVEDKGGGEVVKRDGYFDACGAGINTEKETDKLYKYFNVVNIHKADTKLSKFQLDCKQGDEEDEIVLTGKKGIFRCSPKEWELENKNAYVAPLSIVLNYGYTKTISKEFNIEKPLR